MTIEDTLNDVARQADQIIDDEFLNFESVLRRFKPDVSVEEYAAASAVFLEVCRKVKHDMLARVEKRLRDG